MKVLSITQDQGGTITIFFDLPDRQIRMSSPFGVLPKTNLDFMLQAASQVFDGVGDYMDDDMKDVASRLQSFTDIVAAAYSPKEQRSLN